MIEPASLDLGNLLRRQARPTDVFTPLKRPILQGYAEPGALPFSRKTKIKCWLFTTLRRNFFMKVRQRRRHPEVEFLPDVHDLPTVDPKPWKSLDGPTVRKALAEVGETYRTALELFYLNNLSYKEIGGTLEIPIGTVMSRLSRGKAQLKSILSASFYGDGGMQRMWGADIPKR